MAQKILIGALIAVVFGMVGWMITEGFSKPNNVSHKATGIPVTLYKSPYCSCCEKWGDYMEGNGYDITVHEEQDMSPIKERFGVPYELESCHTSVIEGYVVEGHIPQEAIEKLLSERPDIKGIGMAGMPSGSPGMPGLKEDFLIYEINHDGTKGDLFLKL